MPGGTFPAWLVAATVAAWLGGLFLIVAFKIVSGRISLRGLLTEPLSREGAPVSRPQLLVTTLTGAALYTATALATPGATSLPEAPLWLVAALGGSHLLYLGSRGVTALLTEFLRRK